MHSPFGSSLSPESRRPQLQPPPPFATTTTARNNHQRKSSQFLTLIKNFLLMCRSLLRYVTFAEEPVLCVSVCCILDG
ncbi:hypothetical protein Hanom_Chr04g00350831 [Helianthus anomalus]